MKFVFQGSQNLHIRVAISFEALIGFQCLICEIIVHFMPHWPVYSDFMGTFLTPSSPLCQGGGGVGKKNVRRVRSRRL